METMDRTNLRSEGYWEFLIKKSVSRFFLLSSLHERPMHGYDIAKHIETCCEGWCKPTDGMIYPTLKELVGEGYLQCASETIGGRTRKLCRLTSKGEEAYRAGARVWAGVLPYLRASVERAGVDVSWPGGSGTSEGGCCSEALSPTVERTR